MRRFFTSIRFNWNMSIKHVFATLCLHALTIKKRCKGRRGKVSEGRGRDESNKKPTFMVVGVRGRDNIGLHTKKVVVLECKLKIGFKTICWHVRENTSHKKLNCCYQMESKIHCCHCWLIYSNQFIRSSLLSIRCRFFLSQCVICIFL